MMDDPDPPHFAISEGPNVITGMPLDLVDRFQDVLQPL